VTCVLLHKCICHLCNKRIAYLLTYRWLMRLWQDYLLSLYATHYAADLSRYD